MRYSLTFSQREPLAVNFKCCFCSNENSVSVKLDKKGGIGTLSCRQCGQSFQTSIELGGMRDALPLLNHLSALTIFPALTQPIDVYYEWIDACDTVAKEEAIAVTAAPLPVRPSQPNASSRAGLAPGERYTDEDTGFIDDDDADAEAEYADE